MKLALKVLPEILIAAAITLVVTVVRLVGELQGWSSALFSTEPGGGGSPLGATWLVPFFGFWFGRRLAASGGRPASTARTLILPLLGLGVMIGGVIALIGGVEGQEMRDRMPWVFAVGGFAAFLALLGWGRAFLANLLYGLLARLPVIAVQFYAIAEDWGTHYEKVHPSLPPMTAAERGFALMMAQIGFWIPFTIVLGGVFAAFGALTARKT